MTGQLTAYIARITENIDSIPENRREILEQGSEYIASRLRDGSPANLTFICTHNSRRSHLAQVWSQVAAWHYGLSAVHAFSGGTESTACNSRTIDALKRAGLMIAESRHSSNPIYEAHFSPECQPVRLYSKIYDTPENPQSGYAAMMCCSDVDERCPVVMGAEIRIPLHYRDPKEADGTPEEASTYDARCLEIGVEMFYMLSRI